MSSTPVRKLERRGSLALRKGILSAMTRKKRAKQTKSRRATIPTAAAEPLEQILSENEFLPYLASQANSFFRLANFLSASRLESWAENHMFSLSTEANALETFLDDFNARNNKNFSYFTELIASIRGFANAAHALHHLRRRLSKYDIDADAYTKFSAALERAVAWTNDCVGKLINELYVEGSNRKLAITKDAVGETSFPKAFARLRLPRTADEEDVADEEQRIAEVATKYLKICDIVDNLGIEKIEDANRLRHMITRNCSEEKARQYETHVHNLQSKYDTYIKNTSYEANDPKLKRIRGYISITLHLLEYVTHLVHFYERHENDIRYEPTKQRIARTISKLEVLDHAVNFGLFHAASFLKQGRAVALQIFPEYTRMKEVEFEVPSHVELHLRPATLIHKIANHYGTPVQMKIGDGDWIDASSLMRVVVEIGMNAGAQKVSFRGDQNALRDLRILFDCGFCEGDAEFPAQLEYLK
jgi:phosphotransferase system HPr-like phosphotransfer protein